MKLSIEHKLWAEEQRKMRLNQRPVTSSHARKQTEMLERLSGGKSCIKRPKK